MSIETRLAWRNLWRNPRRTALSVAATVFAVVLVMLSEGMGAGSHEKMIEDAVRLQSGHVAISGAGYRDHMTLDYFLPWSPELVEIADSVPSARAWAPRIISFALVSLADASRGVMVMGVDPEREPSVTTISKKVDAGHFLSAQRAPGVREIVLGERLAQDLGAQLGDEVLLYGAAYSLENAYELFTLTGIVDLPDPKIERNLALIHIEDAREFYVYDDRVTEIALLARDADHAPLLIAELEGALVPLAPDGGVFEVQGYEEMMPALVQFILLDDAGLYIMLVILVVVVGFGILNTILMAILERTRELGVVLALGLRPAALFRMVYLESMLLAAVGLGLGLAIALPALLYLNGMEFALTGDDLAATAEFVGMEPVLTFKLKPLNPLGSVLTILGVAALAALYPALKASRGRPVDALRSP
ncbi:ABC transporter permease [Myxococcota bacterium]|nr:ABC transporter permease [Myxococcota bacterium]